MKQTSRVLPDERRIRRSKLGPVLDIHIVLSAGPTRIWEEIHIECRVPDLISHRVTSQRASRVNPRASDARCIVDSSAETPRFACDPSPRRKRSRASLGIRFDVASQLDRMNMSSYQPKSLPVPAK